MFLELQYHPHQVLKIDQSDNGDQLLKFISTLILNMSSLLYPRFWSITNQSLKYSTSIFILSKCVKKVLILFLEIRCDFSKMYSHRPAHKLHIPF